MDAIVTKLSALSDGRTVFPADKRPSRAEAEAAVKTLLRWVGENPEREGLLDTPARVVKAYEELFGGYDADPAEALGRTFEEVAGYDDLVVVRDINFHSHCEHHMVPIIGKAHVAYLPDGKVLGLSKIARVVDIFARRLQTQENLTASIVGAIETTLKPRGTAVIIEAEHQCMVMRGVRTPGTSTITSQFTGVFEGDKEARNHFLDLLDRKG